MALFVAFGLQLIGCVSVSATKVIYLADHGGYRYGVWGSCKSDGDDCTSVGVGYEMHDQDDWYLGSSSQKILTKLLLVHTVAAGLLLVNWLISFGLLKRSNGIVIAMIVATVLGFIGALFSFIVEILLFREYLKWPGYLSIGSIALTLLTLIGLFVMKRYSADDSRGEIVVGPFGSDQEEEKLIKAPKYVPPVRQPVSLQNLSAAGSFDAPKPTPQPTPQPRIVPRPQNSTVNLDRQQETQVPPLHNGQTGVNSQLPQPPKHQKMPARPQPTGNNGLQRPNGRISDASEVPGGPRIPAGTMVSGMDDDRPYSASVISAYASRPAEPSTPRESEESPRARATPEGRPTYGVTHSDSQHAVIDFLGESSAGPGAHRTRNQPMPAASRQPRQQQRQLQPPVEPASAPQASQQTPLDWYLSDPPQHGQNAYFEPPVTQYAYGMPPSPAGSDGSHYTSISQRAPPAPMVAPMVQPMAPQPMYASFPQPAMVPAPMPGMFPPVARQPKPRAPNRSELALDTNPDFSIGPTGRRRRPGGGLV